MGGYVIFGQLSETYIEANIVSGNFLVLLLEAPR